MVRKGLFGDEEPQLKGEKEDPRGQSFPGSGVSKRPTWKQEGLQGWGTEGLEGRSLGEVPGDEVREVGRGQIVQGLVSHGEEFDFFPKASLIYK